MAPKTHYSFTTKFTYVAAATFFLSLTLNLIGLFITLQGNSLVEHSRLGNRIRPRTIPMKVASDSDGYGMRDDNSWASLTPRGHGFVKIDGEFYSLSLYHQLHCLNSFRRAFNMGGNSSHSHYGAIHAEHCLSYMRQMVLCAGDTTLEPALSTTINGVPTKGASGLGVTHHCRDWVQIRHFAEDNYELWKDEGRGFAASEMISDPDD